MGVVKSDPVLKEGKSSGSIRFKDNFSFLMNLKTIDNQPLKLPIRVKVSSNQKVFLDQVIKLKVKFVKSRELRVAALGISQGNVTTLEPSRRLFSSTEKIRHKFRNLADSTRISYTNSIRRSSYCT